MNRMLASSATFLLGMGLLAGGLVSPGEAAQSAAPTLVDAVREATAPFAAATAAEAAGYVPLFGCVSSPQDGAMGLHYLNGGLVGDGELDASKPEALLYEMRDGELRLLGVEYLVLAGAWDEAHDGPPALLGQLFNYVGAPNRYGNPPFYELHVWASQDNPHGMFADWNPTVSCAEYATAS